MKIRSLVALAGLTISFAVPTFAQQANDVVGAWTLVSITLERDGKKTDFYGPNPQGQLMHDANGRFSVIGTRSDLPKLASNNREAGTTEENKAIVQESLASKQIPEMTVASHTLRKPGFDRPIQIDFFVADVTTLTIV